MKILFLFFLFAAAFICDLLYSAGRFPVALLTLSGIVVLYTYASPFILKK